MTLLLFIVVVLIGFSTYFDNRFWGVLLSILAYLPSSALFYGKPDYALRAGFLSWIFIALTQKKRENINLYSILTLWLVYSCGVIFVTYYNSGNWTEGIINVFTHSGFSLTYILIIAIILTRVLNLKIFINDFIIATIIFYAIGGIIQLIIGHQIILNKNAAFFLTESYNYFTQGGRMVGIFSASSHSTATVLNVVFSFLISKLLFLSKRASLFEYLSILIVLVGILLCQNRGNYIPVIFLIIYAIFNIKTQDKMKIIGFIVFSLILFVLYFLNEYSSTKQLSRLYDAYNLIGRLEIYENAFKNFSFIIKNYSIGLGINPIETVGGIQNYYKYVFWLLGENQILNWIMVYGWIITIVFLFFIFKQVKELFNILEIIKKDDNNSNELWIGYGFLFSWFSIAFVYMPNYDVIYLIPFLYTITAIWISDIKRNILKKKDYTLFQCLKKF